jgi:hypothetical protein
MPYDVSWYVEKRIVYVEFHQTLLLEELPPLFAAVMQLRDEGESPVHIFANLSRMEKFPVSLPAIQQVSPLMNGFGVAIIYGVRQQILFFILKVAASFIEIEARVVGTEDEALHMIARLDPTLAYLVD